MSPIVTEVAVSPAFPENFRLVAAPEIRRMPTASGGLAANGSQLLLHLVEKPPNLINGQAVTGQ
jgi:hypothetical protein